MGFQRTMTAVLSLLASALAPGGAAAQAAPGAGGPPGVAVLLVDTDIQQGRIDERIYGHVLEEINHSVVDGLFAEQVQGQGFEARDFETYWRATGREGGARVVEVPFQKGTRSVRLEPGGQSAGIRQGRLYVQQGREYNGSAWLKVESGAPRVQLRVVGARGDVIAEVPLATSGSEWHEAPYSLRSTRTDSTATLEVVASGNGAVLVDFISLARADVRASGMLRPDLLQALEDLRAPFIRWPGGSYASIYRWKDAIGPRVGRVYHPNTIWGDYSDYYGFGTDEFMELARQLETDAMIVLNATTPDPDSVQYAMEWVHYLIDPPTTEWGQLRARNGHPEPYRVRYFQVDNEPMNHGHSAEEYAAIVNAYGSQLRKLAPNSVIVAGGQKRSNDMHFSQKVIDLAGENFDILGVHNYEYEPDLYHTGLQRIEEYLVKLRDYVRGSAHPDIEIGVLEWNLSRSYDWRAGLHAAGSLILYERLGPEVTMTAPALLMRNTSDDPTWTAFIYHDHAGWFPGAPYVVQKLFRPYYAERYLSSARGVFKDQPNRAQFFDEISTMKPEDWRPATVDAIATQSADGARIIIKAVNYDGTAHTLLARVQGARAPNAAVVKVHTIAASPTDSASLRAPDRIKPVESTLPFARDLAIPMPAYSVVLVEIASRGAAGAEEVPDDE